MKTNNELLEIAKQIIEDNNDINAALTGSLLLYHLGIETRNTSNDIDIVCDHLAEKDSGYPFMFPNKWKEISMDGRKSQVDAISFECDGIKVDFLQSDDKKIVINGINCGSVIKLIERKIYYAKNDLSEESKQKHIDDLKFLGIDIIC